MILFVCQNSRNEIWKFDRNLPLATFGSERVNKNVVKGRSALPSILKHLKLFLSSVIILLISYLQMLQQE